MFIAQKSKYYWDVTRNMSYEQGQEYLKQKKDTKLNKIINHIKIKNNEWNTKNRC